MANSDTKRARALMARHYEESRKIETAMGNAWARPWPTDDAVTNLRILRPED